MKIVQNRNDTLVSLEEIPEGSYKSQAHSGYRWNGNGLFNYYKTNIGKDSLVYSPTRVILPSRMSPDKVYENTYGWVSFGQDGKRVGGGQVVQNQRLIGKQSITTTRGRFTDCLMVETIWFDPTDKNAVKKRKVVWYARDIGPVKVEHDIKLDDTSLHGKMSAMLKK